MTRARTGLAWVLGLATALGLLAPSEAAAGNGGHVRTPVEWSGAPCMTIIDRSVSPIHEFAYAIPYEDTELTEDEVADSRTHQFLAFCRDRDLDEPLPGWISEADIQPAVDLGLGDPAELDLELDVLANSPVWADCWTRITEDLERRPITYEAAAAPIVWDTTALAAGTWVVNGYTHEPWFNLWTAHPGVFKIVDDPDPAASGPAASLDGPEQNLEFGESTMVTGCVDAMAGATMRLSWAIANPNGELAWTEFGELDAETGAFSVPFEPPIETASNPVLIRLEVVDPMGRSWVAHSRNQIGVTDPSAGDEGCEGPFGDPCAEEEEGEGSGSGESSSSGPMADGGDSAGDSGDGCACTSEPARDASPSGFVWLVVLLAGVGFSSRR